jgi:hypothetical protein
MTHEVEIDRDQIAAMFGVHRRDVWDLAARPGFPVPVGYFRGRTLWDADEVTACVGRVVSGETTVIAEVAS